MRPTSGHTMHPATVLRPLLGLLPSVFIMRAFGRAQRDALRFKRPDVPLSNLARRRSLGGVVDFANYTPEGVPHVQRMRDCLLLMVIVRFPVFAVALFW